MKKSWIFYVASRYIFKGRSNSPILAVLGIATGVLALIVIIAVMNGFQLGFIESILEVSSYHLRAESFNEDNLSLLEDKIRNVPAVETAVPFKEYQAIARGRRTGQQAVIVRGLNEYALANDKGMAAKLEFEEGRFNISSPNSILLGSELSRRLGVYLGDELDLFSIKGIFSAEEDSAALDVFTVTGVFRTGYYEYDASWAFININNESFLVNDSGIMLGIKLSNRFNDKIALEQIKNELSSNPEFEDINIMSWRDYNRSFFGALRTEKLFMFILVGLIFIVVGLNIFQGQRRTVMQRREEIGLLRAIGGTEISVRFVFVLDGAIIGLTGAVIGMTAGIGIALNIQGFFTFIENIVNGALKLFNGIASFFGAGVSGTFSIFSPAVFYLKEVPSRVLPMEVLIIFLFGFLSALVAAWFASRKIIKIQPAEVLRYE